MELKLNQEFDDNYKKSKNAYPKLEALNKNIKNIKDDIKLNNRIKEDLEIKRDRAKEDNDNTTVKDAETNIKDVEKKLKELNDKLKKIQEILNKSKKTVDDHINFLSEKPEFKAHINSILEKRYNRQIKKAKSEKEQVDIIINLCEKHHTAENNLKGIIRSYEEVEKIKIELAKLDPIKDKGEYDKLIKTKDDFNTKANVNIKSLMDICKKNDVEISEQFLVKLVTETSFSHDKGTGEIQLSKTLKNISKGYDKEINFYTKSIEKIPNAKVWEDKGNLSGQENDLINKEPTNSKNKETNNLPVKKIKWWHFRERYKSWKERKNVEKENKENKENEDSKNLSDDFRNSYKYEVVKDYVSLEEKRIKSEVKQDMKKEKDETHNNDEGRD